jgi:hypothetical protein
MSGELVVGTGVRIPQKSDERELVPTDFHCFSGVACVAVGTGEAIVFAPARFSN